MAMLYGSNWNNVVVWGLAYYNRLIILILLCISIELAFFRRIIPNKLQMVKNAMLISYLIVIVKITGLLEMEYSLSALLHGGYMLNLVPLVNIDKAQALANIMLFIPLGVLLPLVFYKIKWSTSKILIVSSLLTLTIELLQMSGGRCFDVDDIILNIIGGVLGYATLCITRFLRRRLSSKSKKIIASIIYSIGALCVLLLIISAIVRNNRVINPNSIIIEIMNDISVFLLGVCFVPMLISCLLLLSSYGIADRKKKVLVLLPGIITGIPVMVSTCWLIYMLFATYLRAAGIGG